MKKSTILGDTVIYSMLKIQQCIIEQKNNMIIKIVYTF